MRTVTALFILLTACPADDDAGEGETGAADSAATPEATSADPNTSTASAPDDESSTSAGAPTASLLGHVQRDAQAMLAEGNDGIGTLIVGVFDGCEEDAMLVTFTNVPEADFSTPDNVVDFTIPDLAAGEYDVRVFVDDNGDASALAPAPGPGDLVAGMCSVATLSGDDVDFDVALSAVIPAE